MKKFAKVPKRNEYGYGKWLLPSYGKDGAGKDEASHPAENGGRTDPGH